MNNRIEEWSDDWRDYTKRQCSTCDWVRDEPPEDQPPPKAEDDERSSFHVLHAMKGES